MWFPSFLLILGLSLGTASPPIFDDYTGGLLHLPDAPNDVPEVTTRSANGTSYRLPGNISPESYFLQITPNFDADNFTGSVLITFNVLADTDVIVIHRRSLDISQDDISVVCDRATNYGILGTNLSEIEDQQFLYINLNQTLTNGSRCTLDISYFQAPFATAAENGFYSGRYIDEDGVEQRFAMTKFEPTHARRAFPCFDEPGLKAVFTVTIVRPSDYQSNSNTPLVNSTLLSNGLYLDTFNQTVRMSTYLVSWVISKFTFTEQLERHRILGRPSEINSGRAQYTLNVGYNSLRALESLTGVTFALPKMDQLAVPEGYFTSGAMEDWGMVTYREAYLFYYNDSTTATYQQYMNTIVSHEFSHQWFGDLVTPTWWSYIWLNEGFASYFEFRTVAELEPTWEMMDQFVIRDTQYAMVEDSAATIRHMNRDAQTPTEIRALFDRVAYDKAGAVIRQLETIVTEANFFRGLNIYLNNRAFQNAEPADLYEGIQTAVDESGYRIADGLTVAEIMETWTENAGYPVLRVQRNYNNGSVTLSQSRFLLTNATEITDRIWFIPINTATRSSYNFSNFNIEFFLTTASATRQLNLNSNDWFLVNKGERGYYRVNYDETNWGLLANYLNSNNFDRIPKTSRAQLIDDSFNLARSGRLNYEVPLNLMSLFSRDTDYIPVYAFLTALSFVDNMLAATDEYNAFRNYVVSLLEVVYNDVGIQQLASDSHLTRLKRPSVINWACNYGLERCQQDALQVVRRLETGDLSSLPATIEQQVLCGALMIGNQNDWDFVFAQYVASNDSLQRTRLLNSLGCSQNRTILRRYFALALNSSDIPQSDRLSVFSLTYSKGNVALETELDFIRENLESIVNVVSIGSTLTGIGGRLTTQAQLEALEELQQTYGAYSSLFTGAIAATRSNIEWSNRYRDQITSWVRATTSPNTTPPSSSSDSTSTTTSAPESTPADGGASSLLYHPLLFVLPIVFSLLNRQ